MFNKRLLKTFKAEMKNVYGLVLIQWLVLICHILLTFLHSYVLSCLYLKQSFSLVFYLLSLICLFALKCFLQTTQNKQALSLSEKMCIRDSTKASPTYPPTPSKPKIATRLFFNLSMASFPYNNCVLEN